MCGKHAFLKSTYHCHTGTSIINSFMPWPVISYSCRSTVGFGLELHIRIRSLITPHPWTSLVIGFESRVRVKTELKRNHQKFGMSSFVHLVKQYTSGLIIRLVYGLIPTVTFISSI